MSDNDCVSRKAVLALLNATSQEEITDECYDRLYDAVANMDAAPQEMSAREYVDALERMFSEDHSAYDEWYEAMIGDDGELHESRHHAVAIVEQWAQEHPERSEE